MSNERYKLKRELEPQLRLLRAQKNDLELINFNHKNKEIRDAMIDKQITLIREYEDAIKTLEGLING